MKKPIINLILFIVIIFAAIIIMLSTVGIETNKFNSLISNKASQTKNINLELNTIKFKINPKELSLFLETQNPKIIFKDILVPVNNIKVYIDFFSLLKSEPKIEKTILLLEELDITQVNKLSVMIKPSNFKSLLNNKIKEGKLITEIEIFFTQQGELKDYIAKGSVRGLKAELFSELDFKEVDFSFFADKNDVLIKSIVGDLGGVEISDGDIKLNLEDGLTLNSNFNTKLEFDRKFYNNHSSFFTKYNIVKNIKNLTANFNNNISIEFDNTYKVKEYSYNISGKIQKGNFILSNPIRNNFITDELKEIFFSDTQIKIVLDSEKRKFSGEGKYSFNSKDFFKLNFENDYIKEVVNLKLNFDFNNAINFDLINYKKSKKTIANIFLDLEIKSDLIKINKLNFKEENNLIKINDVYLKKNKLLSFKQVEVFTPKNDFFIKNEKKIIIKGKKFDASNLAKLLSSKEDKNTFQKISSNIEIDFKNITVPMSEKLQNFKLIGEIKKGKFVKISSKGDYGGKNYLDISMKKDKNSDKKYLEIYSDLTRPLLTEYNFFKGLSGGKLLFTSIIEGTKSNSKLKIENFKVVNAPGVIKLLSLADLGGLADLAQGDGLSFDILEIDMEKNKNFLKINEILALGPSMSVLMEGYQDENNLTSLKGTLVPAKTLNKMISKIPVIGNIIIPKEAGEGLFGISFKMKGPKDNIKTSINPIRTLTPRFIQKIIERGKISK